MSSLDSSSPARYVLRDAERLKNNKGPDTYFYGSPRLCFHVDQGFVDQLTQLYREQIPPGGAVLDMMSSWVSHLPSEISYSRVDGQGMNMEELQRNKRLDAKRYLQQPEKVFADVGRVLKPGGVAIFSFSNRMFYDKAISGWINRSDYARLQLVSEYFSAAGGFTSSELIRRSPGAASGIIAEIGKVLGIMGTGDPFLAVLARKAGA